MRAWTDVAVLAKTRNLAGGFVVKSTAGLPFLLQVGMEVAFVPPVTDVPRRARVSQITGATDTTAQVLFEGIEEMSQAKALVGCHCLVRSESLDLASPAVGALSWVGARVVDERFGLLGEVSDILENPGQMLLEVVSADRKNPLLIPLVDEFVMSADPDGSRIVVSVPEGLLNL